MKKDLAIIFGLFLAVVGLLAFGSGFSSIGFVGGGARSGTNQSSNVPKKDSVTVSAKTMVIEAKVLDSSGERKKGLSGADSLPLSDGMLFVFEKSGSYAFWMKDVKFAIDIIWISEERKIVDIAANVAPEPGKKDSELRLYRPRAEAMYVLETNAGINGLHNLQIGDQINFEL